MKFLEKNNNKILIETTSSETQLLKSVLLSSDHFLMDHDKTITVAELDILEELITNYYKKDVSRNRGSRMELGGRQLNMLKDAAGEALRDIASFEFELRHTGTEQETFELLMALKQIQFEAKDYGNNHLIDSDA